jgi:hypothetical protein
LVDAQEQDVDPCLVLDVWIDLLRRGLGLWFGIVPLLGLWLLLRALLWLWISIGSRNDRDGLELGMRGNGAECRISPVPQVEAYYYKTQKQEGVYQLGPGKGRTTCPGVVAACLLSLPLTIDCT